MGRPAVTTWPDRRSHREAHGPGPDPRPPAPLRRPGPQNPAGDGEAGEGAGASRGDEECSASRDPWAALYSLGSTRLRFVASPGFCTLRFKPATPRPSPKSWSLDPTRKPQLAQQQSSHDGSGPDERGPSTQSARCIGAVFIGAAHPALQLHPILLVEKHLHQRFRSIVGVHAR